MENKIVDSIHEKLKEFDEIRTNSRNYFLAPKGEIQTSLNEHTELVEGLFIIDTSTNEQLKKGITILHVYTTKNVEFGEHLHDNQGQILYIKNGYIIHNGIKYYPDEICLIQKNENHSIIYEKDTEAILIYLPNLPLL